MFDSGGAFGYRGPYGATSINPAFPRPADGRPAAAASLIDSALRSGIGALPPPFGANGMSGRADD